MSGCDGHDHSSGGGGGGGHHHGHGSSSCEHEHAHGDGELGVQFSLYQKIDLDNLVCLNEAAEDSGKTVFKPWDQRHDRERSVESDDDDPELLFIIPFLGRVKLKSIVLSGDDGPTHPANMRLFANKPIRSFDDLSIPADQEFELMRDPNAEIDYPLKVTRFGSVYSLSLHIQRNFGGECSKIYFIGLRGEFMQERREELKLTSYEAYANPADHKLKHLESNTYTIR